MSSTARIQLVRHATLLLEIGGKKVLVDPMLSAQGQMEPIANCGNNIRIPVVDLSFDRLELERVLSEVDAIISSRGFT